MNRRFGIWYTATASVVALLSAASAAPGSLNDQYSFDVPSGSLAHVISEIAIQAKASITFPGQSHAELTTKGVRGKLTLQEALSQVLLGTGWHLSVETDGTLKIVSDSDSSERVVVTARPTDFSRLDSSLLTRTDTSLQHTAATIDSVTAEILESQNALSVGDALRNIPGVLFSVGGTSQAIIGQDTTGGVTYSGGLRNSASAQNPTVTNVEAIEVLKGPAAILTGARVGGGVINFIPKRATGAPLYKFSAGVGSNNEYFATADVGGTLSAEEGLYWRLAALYDHADALPNGGKKSYAGSINPMLGYRIDGFSLDIAAEYNKSRTPFLNLVAYDAMTKSFNAFGTRINSEAQTLADSKRFYYNLEKDLPSIGDVSLQFRARGQIQAVTRAVQFQSPVLYDYASMGSYVTNLASYGKDKEITQYADIYAKFATGPVNHQVIAALDVRQDIYSGSNIYPDAFITSGTTNALLDIPKSATRGDQNTQEYGLVFQDQLEYGAWHGVVGLRQSYYNSSLYDVNLFTQVKDTTATKVSTQKFLPNAGLVYDVFDNLSAYVSYSNDFKATQASYKAYSGAALPPQSRTQYEAGVKTSVLDDKVTLNASINTYTTDSDITSDLTHPGYYVSTSGQKGSGYEVSFSGSVTPTIKVLGGFTFSQAKYNDGYPDTNPRWVSNLWGVKTFQLDDNSAIEFALGANYNSGFNAADNTSYPSASYGTYVYVAREYFAVNTGLSYSFSNYKINATIDNLFDRDNYVPSSATAQITQAKPRTFRISVSANL